MYKGIMLGAVEDKKMKSEIVLYLMVTKKALYNKTISVAHENSGLFLLLILVPQGSVILKLFFFWYLLFLHHPHFPNVPLCPPREPYLTIKDKKFKRQINKTKYCNN